MIEYLNQLDASVLLFFNGMHSPFFDKFMMLCTGKFIWIPMYATILFILFKSFKPKLVLVYAIALGVAIALTDQTCASIIRPVWNDYARQIREILYRNMYTLSMDTVAAATASRHAMPPTHLHLPCSSCVLCADGDLPYLFSVGLYSTHIHAFIWAYIIPATCLSEHL